MPRPDSWQRSPMTDTLSLGLVPWAMGPDLSAGLIAEQAALAEQWGYQSFFVPENHFVASTPLPDPFILLAAAAASTQHIRLGTTSWLLPIREPILAAAQAASLDQLSGGRLILGLGRGYRAEMLQAFGVPIAEKRSRFDTVLATMQSAWSGAPVMGDQSLSPLPLQQPHPELWVAAFGPKAIAQAGRLGLPYFASPLESIKELKHNFSLHDSALAEHGFTQPKTRAIMRTVFISDDTASVDAVRQQLRMQPQGPIRRENQPDIDEVCLLGSVRSVKERLASLRDTLSLTHLIAVRPRVKGVAPTALEGSFKELAELYV